MTRDEQKTETDDPSSEPPDEALSDSSDGQGEESSSREESTDEPNSGPETDLWRRLREADEPREELPTGEEITGQVNLKHVIRKLRAGDVVRVTTEPESYADEFTLDIDSGCGGVLECNDGDYLLVREDMRKPPSQTYSPFGDPWLRTGGGYSRGRLDTLTILSMEVT